MRVKVAPDPPVVDTTETWVIKDFAPTTRSSTALATINISFIPLDFLKILTKIYLIVTSNTRCMKTAWTIRDLGSANSLEKNAIDKVIILIIILTIDIVAIISIKLFFIILNTLLNKRIKIMEMVI